MEKILIPYINYIIKNYSEFIYNDDMNDLCNNNNKENNNKNSENNIKSNFIDNNKKRKSISV